MNPLELARKAPRKPGNALSRIHTVRTRDGGKKTFKYSRGQAIKLMCVECLGWETHPKECTSPLCPLYVFRGSTMASQEGEKEDG